MKEKIKNFIEMLEGPSYKDLKREWEIQNATIDRMTKTIASLEQKYKSLKTEKDSLYEYYEDKVDGYEVIIANYKKEIERIDSEYTDIINELKAEIIEKDKKLKAKATKKKDVKTETEEAPKKRGRKKKEEVNNV